MTIVQESWSLTLLPSPSAPLGQRSTCRSVLSTLIPSYWPEVNRTEWTNSGVAQRVDGVNSLCGLPPSPFGSLVPQSLLGRIRTSCSLWGHPLSQPTASSKLLTPALHLNPGSLAPSLLPSLPTPHISCPRLSAHSPSLAPHFILSSDPLYSPGPQVELVMWGLPPSLHTSPAE